MRPPAFQFYVDDFLGGTMNFTDAELGLYIRLLCVQWSTGSVPDDDLELANYGKGTTPVSKVKLKFKKCPDGTLKNNRMEIERKKQNAFRKSRSLNGKLGGRPSKASGKLVVLKTEAKKSSPSPVSSLLSPEEDQDGLVPIPENLNTEEFKSAWLLWLENLSQKRKTPTILAMELQLKKLSEWGLFRAKAALAHSTMGNYQGIYEERSDTKNIKSNTRNFGLTNDHAEQSRQVVAELARRKAVADAQRQPLPNEVATEMDRS